MICKLKPSNFKKKIVGTYFPTPIYLECLEGKAIELI